MAARIDNRYHLVAGVLSSDPIRSISGAQEIGIPEKRGYASVAQMLDAQLYRIPDDQTGQSNGLRR